MIEMKSKIPFKPSRARKQKYSYNYKLVEIETQRLFSTLEAKGNNSHPHLHPPWADHSENGTRNEMKFAGL